MILLPPHLARRKKTLTLGAKRNWRRARRGPTHPPAGGRQYCWPETNTKIKATPMNTFRTYITKQESIYCGFSPELEVFSYGACSEEALNGLQEEYRRQPPVRAGRSEGPIGEGIDVQ